MNKVHKQLFSYNNYNNNNNNNNDNNNNKNNNNDNSNNNNNNVYFGFPKIKIGSLSVQTEITC